MLGLLLFPITFAIFAMLLALVIITMGMGELFVMDIGNFNGLLDATNEVGTPLVIFSLLTILVPAIYIAYLVVVLLINKRPRWWVLLATILIWFALLLGTILSGINYAENAPYNEAVRIMKKGDSNNSLSRQIMNSLDTEPDAEQQAEIERLRNDNSAISIDK